MNKHMNIVLTCDENYIKLLVACIISILYNKHADTSVDIYIIEDNFSSYHKNNIKKLETFNNQNNIKIDFIAATSLDLFKDKKHNVLHYTRAVMFRLAIFNLFSNLERVLFIDADTIIQKDLLQLYNEDFEGNYTIATKDTLNSLERYDEYIHYKGNYYIKDVLYSKLFDFPLSAFIKNKLPYLNAGIMLYNIPLIIKDNKHEEIISLLNDFLGVSKFLDQDILSRVFYGKVKNMSKTYNFRLDITSNKDMKQGYQAHIIHYTCKAKPSNLKWLHKVRFFSAFFKYLQMSYLAEPKWKLAFYKYRAYLKRLLKFQLYLD